MNFRLGLVLASSLAVTVGACASSGGTATEASRPSLGGEVLAQGERPRQNQMTDAAKEHLSMGVDAHEEGNTAEAANHFQQALQSATQAIEADQTNPLPWLQGAQANLGLENYAAADSMLTRAEELRPIYLLEIAPLRERTWIQLYQEAAPLVNAGDYEAAIPVFEGAHDIYKGRPEVMITLGQIYVQTGRYDEAIETLQMAMDVIASEEAREGMDSTTVASWDEQAQELPTILAQTYMNAGRYDDAIAALRGLLADDPDNTTLSKSLASLYVQTENPDSARAIYDRLQQRADLSAADYYVIGVGLYQLEDYEAAAESFEQAARGGQNDRDAAEMWARTLQIANPQGETETPAATLQEMKEAAEMWVSMDPYSRNAHLILAQTEQRMGNQAAAGELVRTIEDMDVYVDDLQLRRIPGGGGMVSGSIVNAGAEPGSTVTVRVTFYGNDGQALGTETATVQLAAPEAKQVFQVDLDADVNVSGYTYEIQM